MVETAERDVRETAECHLEAFKLGPGLTETDLEVQAAFMDICMETRGYAFLPDCAENGLYVCNGNRINDDDRCDNLYCQVRSMCDRVALRSNVND